MTSSTFFDLNLDIKFAILSYLDSRSMARLGQTCTYFASLVRGLFAFQSVRLNVLGYMMQDNPESMNYRAGVTVGNIFYMPFMRDASVCYTFDMRTQQWDCHPIKLVNIDRPNPLITCASAIGDNIYLIGGRRLHSYTLSNAMLILNIKDFTLRLVEDATGYAPRPRHEHTVDAVQGRYLVMFGGLCYNSIGENDVFVYDTFENRWFLPQIRGPIPHLRFGHASTVNGTDLYIYGGAQIGNDDGYVMFNDLYKLDCNTWTWYKYEHPDVEKYMRQEIGPAKTDDWEETKDHNSIFTAGFGPTDRFQACMFAYKNKLIVFGGLTIRHDEDDNEYMWNYSLDEICVFNPRLRLWTTMDGNCHGLPVVLSDMSTALISHGCGGFYVYVIGGRKKESEEKRMRMVHDTSTLTEKREISMSIDEAVPKQYIGDDAPLLPSSNSGTRRGSAVSRWKGKALITSTGKAGGVDTYDANFNSDPAKNRAGEDTNSKNQTNSHEMTAQPKNTELSRTIEYFLAATERDIPISHTEMGEEVSSESTESTPEMSSSGDALTSGTTTSSDPAVGQHLYTNYESQSVTPRFGKGKLPSDNNNNDQLAIGDPDTTFDTSTLFTNNEDSLVDSRRRSLNPQNQQAKIYPCTVVLYFGE